MKTKIVAYVIGITALATVPVVAGPHVKVIVPAPPAVVVTPPPVVVEPAATVTVDVGVPDFYVWDGVEFVGVVGTEYYYLGPGNVWIVMDPVRIARFHDWEKIHADWRAHAIANVKYRTDAHGHTVPLRKDKDADHSQGEKSESHGHGH